MKIAAYLDQGRPAVGIVSSDLQSVRAARAVRRGRGAGSAGHRRADGRRQGRCPPPGRRWAWTPFSSPRRCRDRAATSSASARTTTRMRANLPAAASTAARSRAATFRRRPIIFTKVPECVIGHGRAHRDPRGRLDRDRLRSRAGRGDRPGRQGHQGRRGHEACVGLHHRQRRHRARLAKPPPAVGPGQVLRHVLPDGAVAGHRG